MLAEHDDQRFVEQAALIEIVDQAGEALVEAGHQLVLHARIVFPVRVPPGAGEAEAEFVPEHGHETRPRLDEPPRRQRAPGRTASCRSVPAARSAPGSTSRAARMRLLPMRGVRQFAVSIQARRRGTDRAADASLLELLQQGSPLVEAIERQIGRRLRGVAEGEAAIGTNADVWLLELDRVLAKCLGDDAGRPRPGIPVKSGLYAALCRGTRRMALARCTSPVRRLLKAHGRAILSGTPLRGLPRACCRPR